MLIFIHEMVRSLDEVFLLLLLKFIMLNARKIECTQMRLPVLFRGDAR